MASVITIAGEKLFAAKAQANEQLDIDTFIFANVPAQDPTAPINRDEVLPTDHVVHQQIVQQVGRINDNVVVYSTVLDSITGPFEFNWVGLYSSVNQTLVAINHIPSTAKTITEPGAAGNTLNRNFGIEYSGIADLTGINVAPETWQLDFTARLQGMDELTRNLAKDLNGPNSFIDYGFKVEPRPTANTFKVLPGIGYVDGLRVELETEEILIADSYPKNVYLDAYFDGEASSTWKPKHLLNITGDELVDYIDGTGKQHYLVKIAVISATDQVEDLRVSFTEKQDSYIRSFETVAEAKADKFLRVGQKISIDERGDAEFRVVSKSGVDVDGFGVIASTGVNTIAFYLVCNYNLKLDWFGAKGDGVADDYPSINAAIAKAKSLAFGAKIKANPLKSYLVQTGIVIDKEGVILDMQDATLTADFAEGVAVTVGDAVTAMGHLGIRNTFLRTTRPETTLSGIKYTKNVRRMVAYEKLRIASFKGTGLEFEELNWSMQANVSPLIEACGTNLVIGENGNAITIAGIGLYQAVTDNCVIRGAFQVTFVGGYIQEAGVSGVDITSGSVQIANSIRFYGTYFERNLFNDIVARDGLGLTVNGCYMKHDLGGSASIALINWTGADIAGNNPTGLSIGIQKDFVWADDNCSLIKVGKQNVTTKIDANICQQAGSSKAGLVEAFNTELDVLPVVSNLNVGAIVNRIPDGMESSRPYISRTNAKKDRRFSELALQPVKQNAAAGGATLTPNLSNYRVFDISMTANMTINAPVGEFKDGDSFTVILKNSGAGGLTVVFNAIYKTSYSDTGNTSATYTALTFTYSQGRNVWVQVGYLPWV